LGWTGIAGRIMLPTIGRPDDERHRLHRSRANHHFANVPDLFE
jgi:hypothetical protein